MSIISIDVGIKNLAFCLFKKVVGSEQLEIIKWDVINLGQEYKKDTSIVCCENIIIKGKKGIPSYKKHCTCEVKYSKNGQNYCLKHAKKHLTILIPISELKMVNIKKLKLKELYELSEKYKTVNEPISFYKKTDLLLLIQKFIDEKCFEQFEQFDQNEKKQVNSSKLDLVTIGKNIKIKLDELLKNGNKNEDENKNEPIFVTHVAIENQIGPIANRMKTIQGMISQYFIMRSIDNNVVIDFVSASNKLKDTNNSSSNTIIKNSSYAERKKMGIEKCVEYIKNNKLEHWLNFFNSHKKKDDLADSFLQGIWYINNLCK